MTGYYVGSGRKPDPDQFNDQNDKEKKNNGQIP